MNVCQLCYGKAKISKDFIAKIAESQRTLHERFKNTKSPRVVIEDIFKKISKVEGISIKKVFSESAPKNDNFDIRRDNDPFRSLDLKIEFESDSEFIVETGLNNSIIAGKDGAHVTSDEGSDSDLFDCDDNESDDSYTPNFKYSAQSNNHSSKNVKKKKKCVKEIYLEAPINFCCSKCKKTFSDFDTLAEHMKSKICFIEEISCKTCNKVFQTKKAMYSHQQIHKPKERVMCEACASDFSSQFDLDTHMESIHKRVVKTDCIFRCSHCDAVFQSHLDLLHHVKEHARERKNASRLCEICARQCANLKAYQSHMSSHKDCSFKCTV